ncbi:flagellar assembly protein A [Sulfurimonas sp.]
MALFGSDKKTKIVKKVRPTVVRTQNVAKEIFNIAKSYDIKPELLDFNILDIQTYTRVKSEKEEGEWEEVTPEALREIDDETTYLNPDFQIKQTYEIEVFSKHKEEAYKNFITAVGANATKCKVYLSIAAGSFIDYNPRFEDDFLDLINKKKIRAGILVHIFDEMLPDVISKISARIRVAQHVEFEQAETHLIAEGFEPTPTTNDALILHFEKNKELDENERIDYASRGFIQSVKKDELLIEYIKPKLGKPGRNCRGEFMKPTEPVVRYEPTFKVDSTIRVVEDEDGIKYYANENGYIAFENDTYVIKNEVDVGEISFKTTGSIKSGINSDVDISVKEADAVKDAVGTGMLVEVTKIKIEGNVGSNAKVIAKEAVVNGQTHKTAMIQADDLQINVHKGKAYGKNIKITRLEHGEIEGEQVKVTQALGGIIRAKEIDIEICTSYVKATASKRIEIQKLQGSENTFTIDPLLQKDAKEELDSNQEKIQELELKIKELNAELKKQTHLVKEATPAFLDIKKRLMHYKKNGVKMPQSFVKKYKQFQAMQENLKNLKAEYEVRQDQLNLLTTKTASFQDNILDARIINRDKWMGYNEIKFKLVDPPVEIVYKPMEGSHEHVFGLVELDEGEYVIRPMDEGGIDTV